MTLLSLYLNLFMNWKLQVYIIIIFLLLSLSASIFLRVQNLPLLAGKYPLDNDSVRFLRQAKIIVQDSKLPQRDMMRWLPLGRDMSRQLSLSSYTIAYLYKFLKIFTPSVTIEQTAIYYPIICFSLNILVFFALINRLFDRYTALISTSIFAVFPSLVPRSMAGFSVFLLAILACLLIIATAFALQPAHTAFNLIALKDNFLTPLGQSRLVRSLAELQRPLSVDWAGRYGIFFLLFSAGALLSMRKLALSLKFNPWLSMASLEILLTGIFFSRFSLNSHLSGENTLSAVAYFGSILLFLFMMLGLYFNSQRSSIVEEWQNRKIAEGMLFTLLWFTLILFTARGAERYNFFFAPTAIAFVGYALFQLWRLAQKKIIHRISRMFGYAFIVVFVAFCLNNYFRVSYSIAKTSQPLISQSWRQALDWMKNNLPKDAVVASWWDYGSWINTLAERATIVDEDHYVPYWIYLMARHVMFGQTEMEALEFLKSHGATHLMISADEIASLPVISTLGSDENFDRRSFIPRFSSQNKVIQSNPSANIFRYGVSGGGVKLDDVLRLNGKTYPKDSWYISGIYLKVEENGQETLNLKEAILEIKVEGKTIKLPPQELYFKGKLMRPKGEALSGGVVVYSKDSNPLKWQVLFLSETVRNALMVRLHLLNENSNFFIPIYPLANQQSKSQSIDSSVRVWKINYPEYIKSNPKYLETEFSEPKLYRSWMLGRR